jgi:hypothetical protein
LRDVTLWRLSLKGLKIPDRMQDGDVQLQALEFNTNNKHKDKSKNKVKKKISKNK